jgi:F420-non-reducing hydrogenase iron-sulfur subunit
MSDLVEPTTVEDAPSPPHDSGPFVPQVLGLICERSVPIDELMRPDGRLREMSNVHLLRFPCSGMIKPSLAQLALDAGWDGVIVTGCGVGDCHFREGNLWARERFLGDRAPNKFRRMDQRRVCMIWKAASEPDEFLGEVRTFLDLLNTLPPNERKADAKGKKR